MITTWALLAALALAPVASSPKQPDWEVVVAVPPEMRTQIDVKI